jgi:hypothetical protein
MPTTTAEVLGRRALGRATLARQMLLERATGTTAAEAVAHLVGLQAQAPFSPYYGLLARLEGFTPDTVADGLVDRSLVRIVLMRGTVHLVTAEDALVLRPFIQPLMDRAVAMTPQYAEGLRAVAPDELAAAARALVEEAPRTNGELADALAERWPDADRASLAFGARGLLPLVQVPPRAVWGNSAQARLTTLDSWVGRPLAAEPPRASIVERYLGAFGPASVADLQLWCGLTRLREVVDGLRPRLATFRSEAGVELFDLPDAPRPGPDVEAPVRLLPDFDNLLRSHADRTRVISDADRKRITPTNGVTPHAVLVDGEFAGTWRLTQAKGTVGVAVELSSPVTRARRADVAAEAARVAAFTSPDADHDVTVTDRQA